MRSTARVFYTYDRYSSLVYLTGGGLMWAFPSYQNNRIRPDCLSAFLKKCCKKTLTHRNIRGLAKICRMVEKGGNGFYLNKRNM